MKLPTLGFIALRICCNSLGPRASLAQGACFDYSLSLRPTVIAGSRFAFSGEWIGETFQARDTVITGMTFWRPATDRSAIGAHLWIAAVDSSFSPPRPNVSEILLDGPTVTVYDSNPPGQTIEMPFVIDPPLALPRRGQYAWPAAAGELLPG
jgi:hypothetical protein